MSEKVLHFQLLLSIIVSSITFICSQRILIFSEQRSTITCRRMQPCRAEKHRSTGLRKKRNGWIFPQPIQLFAEKQMQENIYHLFLPTELMVRSSLNLAIKENSATCISAPARNIFSRKIIRHNLKLRQ